MSTPDPRLVAALAGRYRIERELGEGGMATVWLAHDLKHDRPVAMKVLKPELAAQVGGGRFLAEIRTTANLQHPHILPLFDSGEADGFLFYVMPFVEGESLRDRLDREKQLPVDVAVSIARKVAGALQEAHDRGVVHRDVKPANILLDHRGEPLVADFGIALAVQEAGGGRLTETGLSLGTPYYMSPEQTTGDRTPDARSDVWSLGCVLWEMLAGEPPFHGSTAQAVLGRILTQDLPSLSAARKSVPANVAHALSAALEKLPADRIESARAFSDALADSNYRAPGAALGTVGAGSWWRDPRSIALGAALGVLALAAGTGWMGRAPATDAAPPGVVRFLIESRQLIQPLGVRPDGTVVMGVGTSSNGIVAMRRPGSPQLDTVRAVGSAATIVGRVTPDGDGILIAVPHPEIEGSWTVLRVDLDTGAERFLGTLPHRANGLAQTADGTVWATVQGTGLIRMPSGAEGLDTLPYPNAILVSELPGDSHLLLTVVDLEAESPGAKTVLLDTRSGDTTTVLPSGGGVWVQPGYLLYGAPPARLMAVPFDLDRMVTSGAEREVESEVFQVLGITLAAVNEQGVLAYTLPNFSVIAEGWRLLWGVPGNLRAVGPVLSHLDVNLSPDGGRASYTLDDQAWVIDLESGTTRQLTFEAGAVHNPVWTPDGREIVYLEFIGDAGDSLRDSRMRRIAVDGSRNPEDLPDTHPITAPQQILADGTVVLVPSSVDAGNGIWVLRPGESTPVEILNRSGNEELPRVSPDGEYMSYLDTGGVYVSRFPSMEGRWRVWSGEAVSAEWSPDGTSILIQNAEIPEMWRVAVETSAGFSSAAPELLPSTPPVQAIHGVGPGGRLLGTGSFVPSDSDSYAVMVALNWWTHLERIFAEDGGN